MFLDYSPLYLKSILYHLRTSRLYLSNNYTGQKYLLWDSFTVVVWRLGSAPFGTVRSSWFKPPDHEIIGVQTNWLLAKSKEMRRRVNVRGHERRNLFCQQLTATRQRGVILVRRVVAFRNGRKLDGLRREIEETVRWARNSGCYSSRAGLPPNQANNQQSNTAWMERSHHQLVRYQHIKPGANIARRHSGRVIRKIRLTNICRGWTWTSWFDRSSSSKPAW